MNKIILSAEAGIYLAIIAIGVMAMLYVVVEMIPLFKNYNEERKHK